MLCGNKAQTFLGVCIFFKGFNELKKKNPLLVTLLRTKDIKLVIIFMNY